MKKTMMMMLLGLTACLAEAQAEADPNFYVYLCFGQSNMEGNATPEAQDYKDVDPRFQTLACVDFTNPARTKGQWYTATPPIVRQGTGLGMADYFGRTMVKNLPDDVRVGVVDVAIGGTKIEGFMQDKVADYIASMTSSEQWLKNFFAAYDNDPYQRLVDMARIAQQEGVIKGILLHQGESNNGQQDWPQKVKTIYDRLLEDLGLDAADVPLFVGETVRSEQGGACGGHNSVIAKVPGVIDNSYVISSEGLAQRGDGLHFTARSYRIMGQRYARQALQLMGIEAEVDDPDTQVGDQEEQLEASIDYTTLTSYPYYRLEPPTGASFDVKDGALVIENTKEQEQMYNVQPIVLDRFNLEAGADYVVRIDMETSAAGNYWLAVGTWANSMANYGLSFAKGRQTVSVAFNHSTASTSGSDAHILFQCGKFIGTVKIYTVELLKMVEKDVTSVGTVPQAMTHSDAIYTLGGCRLSGRPARPGIYIKDGKRVIL